MLGDSNSHIGRRTTLKAIAGVTGAGFFAGCLSDGDGVLDSPLRVVCPVPAEHFIWSNIVAEFLDRVREESDGRVEFDEFPGQALADAGEEVVYLQDGAADMGYLIQAYFGDIMPLTDFVGTPGFINNAVQGTDALWELANPEDGVLYDLEFEPTGIRPLTSSAFDPYQLQTLDDVGEVRSPDGWQGLNVRSSGGTMSLGIEALGGTAVDIPIPESYEALERGTVDSSVGPINLIQTWDWQFVTDYSTVNAPLGTSPGTISIREDLWEELPSDIRDIMSDVGEDMVEYTGAAWAEDTNTELQALEESGEMNFYELSNAEVSEWEDVLQAAGEDYILGLENGQEVYDEFISLV